MDRKRLIDRLELDDHQAGEEDIDVQLTIEISVLVENRDPGLPDELDPALFQFMTEAFLVDGLKEPWTESPMNLDRRTDNRCGHRVMILPQIPAHGSSR